MLFFQTWTTFLGTLLRVPGLQPAQTTGTQDRFMQIKREYFKELCVKHVKYALSNGKLLEHIK
jgi:hypothetical protein